VVPDMNLARALSERRRASSRDRRRPVRGVDEGSREPHDGEARGRVTAPGACLITTDRGRAGATARLSPTRR
jgi:hypothetical protein